MNEKLTKAVLWSIATLIGIVVGVGTIHGQFIMPSVSTEVRKIIKEEIGTHSMQTHRGAATQKDIDSIVSWMQKLARQETVEDIKKRIERIEVRLER